MKLTKMLLAHTHNTTFPLKKSKMEKMRINFIIFWDPY